MNPLRYPGSKAVLAPILARYCKLNQLEVERVSEPFGGSAAISLFLLERGLVKGAAVNEIDPLLYSFWRSIQIDPREICERIMSAVVSLDSWYFYRSFFDPRVAKSQSIHDLGFAALFLNRTNYSGILGAGPIGGREQSSRFSLDCRFYRETLVRRIRNIQPVLSDVEFYNLHAFEFIEREENADRTLLYVDPPYYSNGKKLYRFYFEPEEHQRLQELLEAHPVEWVLSYDNARYIRDLYSRYSVISTPIGYSVRMRKCVSEIVVLSKVREWPNSRIADSYASDGEAELRPFDGQGAD